MKTRTFLGQALLGCLVAAIGAGGFFMTKVLYDSSISSSTMTESSYKDATYAIEGTPVTLVNGESDIPFSKNSAQKVKTSYFGNEATGDLNGDGVSDTAFLITQNSGGSGTFYYVVVALKTAQGYYGTNAVLLGDRIAPQTTEITNGTLTVNFADRSPEEPMTAMPSVGKSLTLKIEGTTLVKI